MEQKAEAEAEAVAAGEGRAGIPIGSHVPQGEPLNAPPDMVVIGCQEFVALKLDALLLPERSQPKVRLVLGLGLG